MQTFRILCMLLLLTSCFTACKKDKGEEEDEDENYLLFDGKQYTIDKGKIWDYGTNRYSTHYTYAFFLLDGNSFTREGGYTLSAGSPKISIFCYLSAPGATSLANGIYEVADLEGVDWWTGLPSNLTSKRIATFVTIGFDANGDGKIEASETYKATDGNIIVRDDSMEYNLGLSGGKSLFGRTAATMTKQLPPV